MSRIKIKSKFKRLWPRRLVKVFLPVFLVAAVAAVFVFLPSSLAGERDTTVKTRKILYGVSYDKARNELPDEWVWRVRPVNYQRMYRTKR